MYAPLGKVRSVAASRFEGLSRNENEDKGQAMGIHSEVHKQWEHSIHAEHIDVSHSWQQAIECPTREEVTPKKIGGARVRFFVIKKDSYSSGKDTYSSSDKLRYAERLRDKISEKSKILQDRIEQLKSKYYDFLNNNYNNKTMIEESSPQKKESPRLRWGLTQAVSKALSPEHTKINGIRKGKHMEIANTSAIDGIAEKAIKKNPKPST